MTDSYFARPEVSNSDLNELRKTYKCYEDTFDPSSVYKFGSLVDAMLTEPHRVNHFYFTLEENGTQVYFTPQEFDIAREMVKQAKKDPVIMQFILRGDHQKVWSHIGFKFYFDGQEYSIDARCKPDSAIASMKNEIDYKALSVRTKKQFIEAIDHFNYDQQGAWYLGVTNFNVHWIAGISKFTGEVFKYAINRDDKMYFNGVRKYSFWGYRWVTLVDGFKFEHR